MTGRSGRPDYGIDAPGLCRFFFMAGLAALVLCVLAGRLTARFQPWGALLTLLLAIPSLYLLGMGSFMVFESKVTKVKERERLLDMVDWRGDEAVLDVGCGRGLMLVGAARRLSSGKAVGVDIWQAEDQSSNTPDAPLANARLEGVAGRVAVQTADMRNLPFPDRAFDVVTSHWAVHNLKDESERNLALCEIARVLKPGGRLILTDIEHREAYATYLASLGFTDQQVIVSPEKDAILKAITFGTFQPATIFARKASA
jgi:ubiquinone/menaquinone biosynthesis C-methylase UbiE